MTDDTVTKVYRSWANGEPDREWATLRLLAERAPGLAPTPLDRTERDGRPAVVMSRLPGMPLGDGPLTGAQTRAAGQALRALHAVPVEAPLLERVNGPSTFGAEVARRLARDADLSSCRDPRLVAEAVAAGLEWLARASYAGMGDDLVLGAADGNLANLLWDGERCRLVDFEDSGTSLRTYELADAAEHVTFRLAGRGDADALTRAAGLPDDHHAAWTAERPLFACFWLAMLRPGGRGFARNPPGSVEDQARHLLALLSLGDAPRSAGSDAAGHPPGPAATTSKTAKPMVR